MSLTNKFGMPLGKTVIILFLYLLLTDCTIRYEQELSEWEEAVEEVVKDCDQKLK